MENATITICGNTGVDGELRYGASSGKPFLNIPVAVTSGTKEAPKTSWFDVKMFEELAAQFAELPKGTRVIVTGRLRQDVYPDADGVKQYRTVIYAEEAGPSLRWTRKS
jgi:single-strand DNA-binding protein